jgi:2'-5' RNA ligase
VANADTAPALPFPATAPVDTSDPAAVAAHDWDAFGGVKEMINHWERPGWDGAGGILYWLLAPSAPARLIDHARHCQHAIAQFHFDPIAPSRLHLTLARVAPARDLADDQVQALLDHASLNPPPAATVQAVPMTASRGAVRYSVAPWDPVLAIHRHLDTAARAGRLPRPRPTGDLRPHIGIAYCNRVMPAEVVRAELVPLRSLSGVQVRLDRLCLVSLHREPGQYRWEQLAEIPLR